MQERKRTNLIRPRNTKIVAEEVFDPFIYLYVVKRILHLKHIIWSMSLYCQTDQNCDFTILQGGDYNTSKVGAYNTHHSFI